ncbi:CBS domain-containing protein [uncultured Desulfobacter sp.]|uniref:CBS domain-containing protein n=1 Tax=uncultured Desulfobacter sp. TaxID=240139 RepID=UPI0029C6A22D|nr:CBS domain-containing protein [uncultured Desulfobacter sp.]
MDCRICMSPVTTPLYTDQSAGTVIDFMRKQHLELVPIVDRDNKFAGLISTAKLMRMLLPKSIGMMRGIKHVGYLRESAEELQARMDDIRSQRIGDLLDPYAQTVHPEASLADALKLISDRQYIVPVVDEDGLLVGAISYFSIMHALEAAQGETP